MKCPTWNQIKSKPHLSLLIDIMLFLSMMAGMVFTVFFVCFCSGWLLSMILVQIRNDPRLDCFNCNHGYLTCTFYGLPALLIMIPVTFISIILGFLTYNLGICCIGIKKDLIELIEDIDNEHTKVNNNQVTPED